MSFGSYTPSSSMIRLFSKVQKRVPIPAIAGEARGLDRQYGAGGAGTDCRQQALKPGAGRAASRATEIIIDDNHVFPAKGTCAICQRVLTTATLRIVSKLIGSRLSDVDVSTARLQAVAPPFFGSNLWIIVGGIFRLALKQQV